MCDQTSVRTCSGCSDYYSISSGLAASVSAALQDWEFVVWLGGAIKIEALIVVVLFWIFA